MYLFFLRHIIIQFDVLTIACSKGPCEARDRASYRIIIISFIIIFPFTLPPPIYFSFPVPIQVLCHPGPMMSLLPSPSLGTVKRNLFNKLFTEKQNNTFSFTVQLSGLSRAATRVTRGKAVLGNSLLLFVVTSCCVSAGVERGWENVDKCE